MTQPPGPPDPNDVTQPFAPVGSATPLPPRGPATPARTRAPYTPTFGNIGGYLLARFAAFLIDLAGLPYLIACFTFNAYDRGMIAFAPRTAAGFAVVTAIAFGGAFVFAILCEALVGTTLGKAVFALGVRRGNGQHAGLQRIILRYLLMPLDLVVIGELLAAITPRHQRIGDFLAGTVVARHRIGAFATVIALLLLGGAVYAQAVAGGGLGSATAVAVESSFYGPAMIGNLVARVGIGAPVPLAPDAMPSSLASSAPNVAASALPQATMQASQAPAAQDVTSVPSETVSEAPASPAADATPPAPDATAASQASPAAQDATPEVTALPATPQPLQTT